MLSNVVDEGTGIEAEIPNYSVAGKTGTVREARSQDGGLFALQIRGLLRRRRTGPPIAPCDPGHCRRAENAIWGGSVAARPSSRSRSTACAIWKSARPTELSAD